MRNSWKNVASDYVCTWDVSRNTAVEKKLMTEQLWWRITDDKSSCIAKVMVDCTPPTYIYYHQVSH